jgi:hypothetical protein
MLEVSAHGFSPMGFLINQNYSMGVNAPYPKDRKSSGIFVVKALRSNLMETSQMLMQFA